jgi:N-acetylglucosaminyl-diphospho-decaprenol L-rhamnosyltransferase
VAVVTVSYHSGAVLPGFLGSIERASVSPVATIVADNSPDPAEPIREQATAAGAGYLPLPGNRGYGAAMNAAIRELPRSVAWVLVSNPDVELRPGTIDALVRTGETDPAIASVGPAILTSSGEVYPSARAVPSLRTGVGHALFVNLWTDNPWTRAYRSDTGPDAGQRDAGWLSGACLLVRRSIFDDVGGFDDGYFMYFEDVDLGYRLGKAGYRNVYEPGAVVVHSGAHSTNEDSAAMLQAHHESAKRFLSKKYPGVILWPVRVALRLGLAVEA